MLNVRSICIKHMFKVCHNVLNSNAKGFTMNCCNMTCYAGFNFRQRPFRDIPEKETSLRIYDLSRISTTRSYRDSSSEYSKRRPESLKNLPEFFRLPQK
ncbi:hypothetical protein NPIL_446431 [Nephila pilipes]|uniref:Uncharacterized protein n=1 Tax=Nephila pilipes TaxID=299642 RepID=A0A8X6MI25_NEPPI|nr:hypothetical protein NPIL_446431 [Nephila pilipes]